MARIFGSRKTDGPDRGRIERTLAQANVPASALPKSENLARRRRAMAYREVTVTYQSGYRRAGVALDYSATGVRIRFPTNESLPPEVFLNARAVGLEGRARVVWQEGLEAGLALIAPPGKAA